MIRCHLFYDFRLEEAVPDDHPVRQDRGRFGFIVGLTANLRLYYPALGRPSIDPVLMLRMLIIGYVFGIRSERLLCREVQVNFAYRWFCKLGIEAQDPRSLGIFAERAMSGSGTAVSLRRVFERVVEACIAAGLVGGEGFAVDASLIEADANKHARSRAQNGKRPVIA